MCATDVYKRQVVEIAAGVFAGQILLVVLGVILLAAAQIFCYAIR